MLLSCDFRSPVLRRNTHIHVFLPTPNTEGAPVPKDVKVLYLLHGLHGDSSSWLYQTSILRYAEEAGIAVVMPSVNNSFYQDMVHGERFFTYMTKELPDFVQNLFPVSRKKEDTYIAGLSMGGYGALYIGLSYPERFAAIASFSGAVDIGYRVTPLEIPEGGSVPLPFFAEDCFGDMAGIAGSDRDVFTLCEKALARGPLPRIYLSCGTEDFLYPMNRLGCGKLTELGARVTWSETAGMDHEWAFWDQEIRRAIHWMLET